MVVRLIAEDRDVLATNQIGEALEVVRSRHAAGRIVRRVEEDRLGFGFALDESFHVVEVGPELALLSQRRKHHAGAAAFDVWAVRGKMRAEHQNRVAGIKKRLAEEL